MQVYHKPPAHIDRYTLLIGKPPFQTKDINAIYKRIKENRYEFPEDKEISSSAQQLIMAILNPNPRELACCVNELLQPRCT